MNQQKREQMFLTWLERAYEIFSDIHLRLLRPREWKIVVLAAINPTMMSSDFINVCLPFEVNPEDPRPYLKAIAEKFINHRFEGRDPTTFYGIAPRTTTGKHVRLEIGFDEPI